jgi:hypothetical protein
MQFDRRQKKLDRSSADQQVGCKQVMFLREYKVKQPFGHSSLTEGVCVEPNCLVMRESQFDVFRGVTTNCYFMISVFWFVTNGGIPDTVTIRGPAILQMGHRVDSNSSRMWMNSGRYQCVQDAASTGMIAARQVRYCTEMLNWQRTEIWEEVF